MSQVALGVSSRSIPHSKPIGCDPRVQCGSANTSRCAETYRSSLNGSNSPLICEHASLTMLLARRNFSRCTFYVSDPGGLNRVTSCGLISNRLPSYYETFDTISSKTFDHAF